MLFWRLLEFGGLLLGLALAAMAIVARVGPAAALSYLWVGIILTGPLMITIASEGRERVVGSLLTGAMLASGVLLIQMTSSDVTASRIPSILFPYLLAICLIDAKFSRIVRALSSQDGLRSVRT